MSINIKLEVKADEWHYCPTVAAQAAAAGFAFEAVESKKAYLPRILIYLEDRLVDVHHGFLSRQHVAQVFANWREIDT